ncbi:MAG: aminoacyltransferase [Firmicutes bacterium]|nr:aminoacyltransferase [Bacillota bacterium]
MKLVDNLTKEEYINFFNKSKYNHFLQSYEWGQASKAKGQTPIYIGMKDDKGNIQAAAMVLKKNTPLKMCYLYAPRGIIIDYSNEKLLNEFTKLLKDYLKGINAIYFKMDPGIVYHEIDDEAKPIADGKNNYELFKKLTNLGYKHQGFTTLFTRNQPRFTFRIDTTRPFEEIEKAMNKTYMKTVKRSYNYDLEVTDSYDTQTFFKLMNDIANRNNFNGNSQIFYEAFDKEFSKEKNVKYITIKIYPDKIISKAKAELEPIQNDLEEGKIPQKKMADTQNIIARLQKDIDTFTPYEGQYPDGLVSLILICPTTNHAMWTLYIGNNDLATYTFSVNRAYYEAVKYASEQGLEFLDLFGTCGEPHTKEKNYAGIHEYKRKLGGTYTEFIGEFDIIAKPFWYRVLPVLLKIYRKLRK